MNKGRRQRHRSEAFFPWSFTQQLACGTKVGETRGHLLSSLLIPPARKVGVLGRSVHMGA